MKSKFSYLKIVAGATCVLATAACDSIKDVENKPAANVQPETVVLGGEIRGLSSLRSITLQNNDDTINTRSVINAVPTLPNVGIRPVPFSFGALPVGSEYNITIKQQPELKNCEVENGQGVLTKGVTPNIVVNCTSTGTRYDLKVFLPSDPDLFTGLLDAKVRVTTEEEIREVTVEPGDTEVLFEDVLIDGSATSNAATYSVNASTFDGNVLSKCVVSFPTGQNAGFRLPTTTPPAPGRPARDMTAAGDAAVVGAVTGVNTDATANACKFTVSGKVGYSQPAGTAYTPTAIDGLQLQLRDLQDNVLETLNVPSCTPTTAAITNVVGSASVTASQTVPNPTNGCQYNFTTPIRSSTGSGVYEVAVSQQPTGQACIVVNGGSVSVFTQGTTPPVNPSNVHVFCRAVPAAASRELNGVFRLQSTVYTPNALGAPATTVTSTWNAFDTTFQNTASSNLMAFFRNGTFLYGTHANGAQVEHGFYDYDPATQRLRFTLIVDTNTGTSFPLTFSPDLAPGATPTSVPTIANTRTFTTGISALPNPIRVTAEGSVHYAMTNVAFGDATSGGLGAVRTISGIFGADPTGLQNYVPQTSGTSCTVTVNAAGVITATNPCYNPLTGAPILAATPAPPSPPNTTATSSLSCSSATFTFPGAPNGNGCYTSYVQRVAWTLQEPGQVDGEMTGGWLVQDGRRAWMWDYRTYYGTSVGMLGGSPSMNDACFTMEDLHASSGIYTRRGSGTGCFPFARPAVGQAYTLGFAESVDLTVFGAATVAVIPQLPGYTGRIPGGQTAPGNFSPSPVYFQVAPADSFFDVADPLYFPTVPTNWCTTEILGLRSTENGQPINPPIYFCRTRFNH